MTNFRPGIIGYLPCKGFGHTDAFLANLENFPPKHRLLLYSKEHDLPGIIRLPANVEDVIPVSSNGIKSIIAINNLVFFTGVSIAASMGLTHMLYIETDCRFGVKHWDEVLFNEFLEKNAKAICGGTPVVFNPASYTREFADKYEKFLHDHPNRPVPMSMTGNGHLGKQWTPCLFPNGALAIYSMEWLLKAFPEITQHKTNSLAVNSKMWDLVIGVKLFDEFKENVFDHVVWIEKMYSGYMDVMTTPDERRQMLESKRIVAVHQIKDDWIGPMPELKLSEANTDDFKPDVEIMIVTHKPDLEFLKYCLRSIAKFATGFSGITVVVPKQHRPSFLWTNKFGCKLVAIEEPEGKGFNNHAAAICSADLYCKADYILHMDADCLFAKPVTPLDYFSGNKPVLLCRNYHHVKDKNHAQWQSRASKALGCSVTHDFMVRHPAVHHRDVYKALRDYIGIVHRIGAADWDFRQWVLNQKSAFPQDFAEFPTLGAYVSLQHSNRYSIIDIGPSEEPPNKMLQGWSKLGVDHTIKWKDGKELSHMQRWKLILNNDKTGQHEA